MKMVFVGCTSVLASIMLLCTGFILAGLKAAAGAASEGGYDFSILDVGIGWFIVSLLFFIAGASLIYIHRKDDYVMTFDEHSD